MDDWCAEGYRKGLVQQMLVTGTVASDFEGIPFPQLDRLVAILPEVAAPHLDPLLVYQAELVDRGLNPSTVRSYTSDARQLLSWLAARRIGLSEITQYSIDDYISWLKTRRRAGAQLAHGYSDLTIRRKLSAIRRFFGFMEVRGYIARNPLHQNMKSYLIDPKPLTVAEPLSKKEVVGLLEAPRVDTPKGLRDRSILSLMVLAGLGISEIHNLDIDDLIDGGSRLKLRGRSGEERSLPLSGEVHTRLVRWMNARSLLVPSCNAMFVSVHWSKTRGLPGRRLSKRGINQIVSTYLRDLGKKSQGACGRILKKTFIALFLDEGAGELDLVEAMDMHPKTARAFMRVSQRIRRHD